MKSFKTLVCVTSLALCFGAASMANAASIKDDGPFTTTNGSIVVKSPSSYQANVTCGITFTGNVSGGIATITDAKLTGGGLCGMPVLKSIPAPGWVLTATSLTTGRVDNVGFTVPASFINPASDCGINSIDVTWNPANHTITANNQTLSGSCSIVSLTATASSLRVE